MKLTSFLFSLYMYPKKTIYIYTFA